MPRTFFKLRRQLFLHPPLGAGVDLVDQSHQQLHQRIRDFRLAGGAQRREQRDPYILGGVAEV
ncbi:hypothetical protein [Streptomyces sp. NPDC001970]